MNLYKWNASNINLGLDQIRQDRNQLLEYFQLTLNKYHNLNCGVSYYNVLAGDWLEFFLHSVYIASIELQNAELEQTTIIRLDPIIVQPDLYSHANSLINDQYFFNSLKKSIYLVQAGVKKLDWEFSDNPLFFESKTPNLLLNLLDIVSKIGTSKPEAVICLPYFKCGFINMIKTIYLWRKWAYFNNFNYPIKFSMSLDVDWRKRKSLEALEKSSEINFLNLVKILMPIYIPAILIEGFAQLKNELESISIKRPKIVYSAVGLHSHLIFKLKIAEWLDMGTRLLYHQHGGHYGIDKEHAHECYETLVATKFYTWGWTCNNPKVSYLSSPPPRYIKGRVKKYTLLICGNFPEFSHRLLFQPMSDAVSKLHNETLIFLKNSSEINNMLIRPYSNDYGWAQKIHMKLAAPNAKIDRNFNRGAPPFSRCNLVISNYLGSSYLESLTLNIPTICFIDKEVYSFREEALELIDELERVGILHYSGESAAKFAVDIFKNPQQWWSKKEVQRIRSVFVEKYANFNVDWRSAMELEFKSQIAKAS